MTQIAAVRLIGIALALVAPGWLVPGNAGSALSGNTALLAIPEHHGAEGLAYLDSVTARFHATAEALIPNGVDVDALEDAAALLERVRSAIGTERPVAIARCTTILESPPGAASEEAIAETAGAAAGWIGASGEASSHLAVTLIGAALATLLLSTAAHPGKHPAQAFAPQAAPASDGGDHASLDPSFDAGDPEDIVVRQTQEILINRVRDHAERELRARVTPELENFGFPTGRTQELASRARAGTPANMDRASRRAEQRIVQAAITDFANARRLSILAATCRGLRAWAACAAGQFDASANHFKLAVRHMANESHGQRASFMTAAIDMSVLASFVAEPERGLLAARERAAELGALVKEAPAAARLQAALAIGHAELAVGRGFDQAGTCATVIAFAEKAAAEARLAGFEALALAAAGLKCRTQLALVIQFGAHSHLAAAERGLAELEAEIDAMLDANLQTADAGGHDGFRPARAATNRLATLLHAAKALGSQDRGALALAAAELAAIAGETPQQSAWATSRTATDVSDGLDAAFLRLRVETALALAQGPPDALRVLFRTIEGCAADLGAWLSPGRAALLDLDLADLLDAATLDTGDRSTAGGLRAGALDTLRVLGHPLGQPAKS